MRVPIIVPDCQPDIYLQARPYIVLFFIMQNNDLVSIINKFFPSEHILSNEEKRASFAEAGSVSYSKSVALLPIQIVETDKKIYFQRNKLTGMASVIIVDKKDIVKVEMEGNVKKITTVPKKSFELNFLNFVDEKENAGSAFGRFNFKLEKLLAHVSIKKAYII